LLPTTVEQISQVGACQTWEQQRTASSATCDGLLQTSTTFAFVTGDCTHTHLTCMTYQATISLKSQQRNTFMYYVHVPCLGPRYLLAVDLQACNWHQQSVMY
jgi:hypothetical protein